MKKLLVVAACLISLSTADTALADNFNGKIRLVQHSAQTGKTRFHTETSISLFATPETRDILMHAFFRKTSVSVSYTKITCPGFLGGTCGTVTDVTADVGNIP